MEWWGENIEAVESVVATCGCCPPVATRTFVSRNRRKYPRVEPPTTGARKLDHAADESKPLNHADGSNDTATDSGSRKDRLIG